MEKIITKKDALARANEFWRKFMASDTEALCFNDNGVSWQIRLDDEDDYFFIISVEGYSEEHDDWETLNDVADIIYEFLNRATL